MFNTITDFSLDAVGSLLAFFYSLPVVGGSYGLAIILLTATVMIVLMPLTIRATRSTIKMTQLQPEMRALQKEYKDDKAQLNQAMMALYQEHGVNPIGGCLPILAQLPVFLILFNVLRGLTRRVSDKPYFQVAERAREIAGAEAMPAATFDPLHLDTNTELYQDLSQDTEMLFGPFDLAADAWDVVQSNFLGSFPYILLILFVVGSSYYQQRQVSARRGSMPDNPTPQQQTQQQLLRILPLMSGIWSFLFPAGLVLYWATSNLFRIGQQAYITQALYKGDGPGSDESVAKAEAARAARAEEKAKQEAKKGKGDRSGGDSSGAGKGKRRAKPADGAAADAQDDQDVQDDLVGDGRPGRRSRASSNGDRGMSNGAPVDRDQAWAQKRAQKAKTRSVKKKAAAEGSSRTTPKGTKPSAQKKRRKR